MKAFLRSSDGILALRPKITTIGKHDDSDIVLKSPGLEDHHAALEFSDAEHSFVLRDFNTGSGSFVNDCQIQNVAVKVGPGDLLRFGSAGPTFELVLDHPAQVPCPPVNRRIAWPGQIQMVTEAAPLPLAAAAPQFPWLPSPQSSPASPSWPYAASGASPRPPLRKRLPGSAWGRTVSSSAFPPEPSSWPPATLTGNGALPAPLAISHAGDALLKEKEETILRLGDEINRLSALESECGRKDTLIAELQHEILAMNEKVVATLAKKDTEFHQKLASLDRDAEAKAEEIRRLKEQVSSLQKDTSEVLYHSLSDRDLQIAHWKQENEALKKSYALTTGLVTSLQKDVVSKEQRIQQLKADTEKLRQESREKDSQLAYISAQCSRIKVETKRELRDRDLSAHQSRIAELELQAGQSKEEIRKRCAEQETLTRRLAEATQAEGQLKQETQRRGQQVQELGRRERLLRAEMEQAAAQAQRFRDQVVRALFPELPEKPLTNEQIVEEIRQVQEGRQGSEQKEAGLQKEMQIQALEMEKLSSNLALLKKSLDGFQEFLKTSFSAQSLKGAITRLQSLPLPAPLASGIQASLARILYGVLGWVEALESLLRNMGVDTPAGDPASESPAKVWIVVVDFYIDQEWRMASYMKQLLDQHHSVTGQVQALQNQLRRAEESQHSALRERLEELEERLEGEFRARERKIREEEKQQKEILAGRAALEEAKSQEALEEERKRGRLLEAELKELSQVIEGRTHLERALKTRAEESLGALEDAKRGKAVAEEKLSARERRLQGLEAEAESLRQKHQQEILEYQEQVKQHARTIVELEERLVSAAQQAEEDRGVSRPRETKEEPCRPPLLPASPGLSVMEEFQAFLKGELAAAKQEIQANQAVIAELKKELCQARATMSDVIGELSEKQKAELEEKRGLVQSQAQELGLLREKLAETSRRLGQRESHLQATTEELRKAREKVKELLAQEAKAGEPARVLQHKGVQTVGALQDETPPAVKEPPLLCLADLGARCKGSRHEEVIHRQKGALAELRKKLRKLEKVPSDTVEGLGPARLALNGATSFPPAEAKKSEPLLVVRKGPAEKPEQAKGKDPTTVLTVAVDAHQPPAGPSGIDPNVATERTARLQMAEALDLSEHLYLSLVRGLSGLMDVEQLMGLRTLKHLPQAEREKVGLLRQKDLELLLDRIGKLKTRLERKESLLKEYEGDAGHLRSNRHSLQACQSEAAKLADQVHRDAEEKALLKEALERTRLQLSKEKRLNKALKKPKLLAVPFLDQLSASHLVLATGTGQAATGLGAAGTTRNGRQKKSPHPTPLALCARPWVPLEVPSEAVCCQKPTQPKANPIRAKRLVSWQVLRRAEKEHLPNLPQETGLPRERAWPPCAFHERTPEK
ncbi:forkhead-associated domain-containing protein 1 [Protobothrops mucrosquamatus]|uniref:forkhead-associated domain-containing protein 1 n=1 Tax=Protobothrops mucrosquamatus TaxID=103944 RepID=UPI0010FB7BA9|nr:forkhead-associated domain-containing protein 1 [Protobothrops mucrosquamatus]